MNKFLLSLALVSLIQLCNAQKPPVLASKDSATKKEPKKMDYAYLSTYAENDTKIFGKVSKAVKPMKVNLYRKDKLYGDSSLMVSDGAEFELLNTELPVNRTMHQMLVKVINDPADKELAGQVGWIWIDQTTLFKFLDETGKHVDTSLVRNKYTRAAAKCREDAAKTTCSANKKCNLMWADYYDCMTKGRYDSPVTCPLVNCSIQDCPGDNK